MQKRGYRAKKCIPNEYFEDMSFYLGNCDGRFEIQMAKLRPLIRIDY